MINNNNNTKQLFVYGFDDDFVAADIELLKWKQGSRSQIKMASRNAVSSYVASLVHMVLSKTGMTSFFAHFNHRFPSLSHSLFFFALLLFFFWVYSSCCCRSEKKKRISTPTNKNCSFINSKHCGRLRIGEITHSFFCLHHIDHECALAELLFFLLLPQPTIKPEDAQVSRALSGSLLPLFTCIKGQQ